MFRERSCSWEDHVKYRLYLTEKVVLISGRSSVEGTGESGSEVLP